MDILGVRVDNLPKNEVLEKIGGFLGEDKIHQIATVNPEFILAAQKDEDFKNILNSCDFNIPDGIGLSVAFWKKGQAIKARIPGADLFEGLLNMAQRNNLGVFLVANSGGLSSWEETRDAILRKYPDLEIDGVNLDKNTIDSSSVNCQMPIVFCNFGAPYQERFLHSLKGEKNDKIKITMGVGGSFDFLTGKLKRAPVFVRSMGLEWLFRLIQQPKRLKRIWNAVIIFPIKVIFYG
jgi:N-acetylglucosaminyldiphosphoundecaprenol N-acetyl-beta-D-mannosaminyltransferase